MIVLIIIGAIAGIIGTLVMDMLNHITAQTGLISKIDIRMIGRMSAGWMQGRFHYNNPDEMKPVSNELVLGYITHHMIGIVLALAFVIVWDWFEAGALSPLWILVYGIATTAASLFFVYPSMGLGVACRKSPDAFKNVLSSLANHFFFGAGMAVAVVLL